MNVARVLVLITGFAVIAAQGAFGAEQDARFTMKRVDEGMLRFDSRSGAVSLCQEQEGQWSCAPVPDTHLKMQQQLEQLRRENAALRSEVEQLKSAAGVGGADPADKKQDRLSPPPMFEPPSDETIDEMMDVLEKMVRRFQDMIESLQKEPAGEEKQL
jgi:hypothetical protein